LQVHCRPRHDAFSVVATKNCKSLHICSSVLMQQFENYGRAMAQVAGLSPRWLEFDERPVLVGFVVDTVALGQVCHRVFPLSLVTVISPVFPTCIPFIYYRRDIISAVEIIVK
jgi:hypothetical protein